MHKLTRSIATGLLALPGMLCWNLPAAWSLDWEWHYSGPEIEASGKLTTNDTPDARGFFTVLSIAGQRNGQPILGLCASGTSIPGSEPFILDNALRLEPEQLTKEGFGFALADGGFINVFFADFLEPPAYHKVHSARPIVSGFENLGPEDSELAIAFVAVAIAPAEAEVPPTQSTHVSCP